MRLEDLPRITVEDPPPDEGSKFKSTVEDLLGRWGERHPPDKIISSIPDPRGCVICIHCRQRLDYEGLCGCGWEEQDQGE